MSPLDQLTALDPWGPGPGVQRVRALLAPLLPALTQLDPLRVCGTNGKGSVSAFTTSTLLALHHRVGTFTSPHLLDLTERFALDGVPLPRPTLQRSAAWVLDRIRTLDQRVGRFEAWTALAAHAFLDADVTAAVFEAGIGGRLDSTAALPGRCVALTSVDLDHTEILGSTLPEILCDKADLCPPGGTLVAGPLPPDLHTTLTAHTAARGVQLLTPAVPQTREAPDGTHADGVRLGLRGAHQAANAAVSRALVHAWRGAPPGWEAAWRAGWADARVRGRLEWVGPVCFDVGHTPAAARAAAAGFVAAAGRGTLVVGVSEVKRVEDVARALLPAAERVVVTRPEHGASVERLAAAVGDCEQIPDPVEALRRARTFGAPVLVAGSLYLVQALLPSCSG